MSISESDWHAEWKSRFPEEWREIAVGNHRADVRTESGIVLEFQNSPISLDEVREREAAYQDMIWVVNVSGLYYGLRILQKDGRLVFRWKYPRDLWWQASKPVYLDSDWKDCPKLSGNLVRILGRVPDTTNFGWCELIEKDDFIKAVTADDRSLVIS